MRFKRLILISLLALATAPSLFAQKKASATMGVSARVVEANAVSYVSQSKLDFKSLDAGKSQNIITLQNHQGPNKVDVSGADSIILTNEKGESFPLSVTINEKSESEDLFFDVTQVPEISIRTRQGNYRGSLTISVVYL